MLWRDTPIWALQILIEEQPAIEAERLAHAAQAASVPHMKDGDRRGLWSELKALSRPRGRISPADGPDAPDAPPATHDPAAAAEHFANLGIRVRKVNTS